MEVTKFILATDKSWHDQLFNELSSDNHNEWIRVRTYLELEAALKKTNPEMIFFPHWSEMIPASIHKNYECVVFHMTDLPYGRGGSPLQNLIVRGKKETVMSAIKIQEEIDAGPVYMKKPLSLDGKAQDIFIRSSKIIGEMINEIINEAPTPIAQKGEPLTFKRRTRDMSNIADIKDLEKIYDYIRMLDADGYPPAYLETDYFKVEFRNSKLKNGVVEADVRIVKK